MSSNERKSSEDKAVRVKNSVYMKWAVLGTILNAVHYCQWMALCNAVLPTCGCMVESVNSRVFFLFLLSVTAVCVCVCVFFSITVYIQSWLLLNQCQYNVSYKTKLNSSHQHCWVMMIYTQPTVMQNDMRKSSHFGDSDCLSKIW